MALAPLLALLGVLTALQSASAADTVVTNCTEAGLNTALTAAQSGGGTITFNCGGPATITVTSAKTIPNNTVIDGGGVITLSGNHLTGVLRTNDNYTFNANNVTVTVRNLIIANGRTTDQGGGIKVGVGNRVTFNNVTFLNNVALKDSAACDGGGAIFIGGGSVVTVTNSVFTNNRANNGGGINNLRSKLTVLNSAFSGNQAAHTDAINQHGDCGGGGAIYIDGTRSAANGGPDAILIQDSAFTNNTTNNHGGALFVGFYPGDNITVDRSSFTGNSVTKAASLSSSGTGGAVWYGRGDPGQAVNVFILTSATFANNYAHSQGGGLWTSAPVSMTNVTFAGNVAANTDYAQLDDWRRGNGGALAVNNSALVVITNGTLANNSAGFNGGAIAGSTVTLRNTLFEDNTGGNPWDIQQHCTSALADGGNNLQYPPKNPNPNYWNETNCTAAITITDPKLGPLQDNGGAILTMMPQPGSPAFNRSNLNCPASDQRGVARPQGGLCDSGAVEAVPVLLISPAVAWAGDPAFMLTVQALAATFVNGNVVRWDGADRTTQFVDSVTLRATISAGDIAAPGTATITVNGSGLAGVPLNILALGGRVYLPVVRK
jgi:predicted outer membrane repeat protein